MSLVIFILLLVALIVVHEFGHFAAAKLARIRVDEFGIGFPPRIVGIRFGETTYTLNLLFFGGFVRIFGESGENVADTRSFSGRPRAVQAAVVVAGVVMNLLFAWLVLSVGFVGGLPVPATAENAAQVRDVKTIITGIVPGTPAAGAGLIEGSSVVRVTTASSREDAVTAETLHSFIANHQNEEVTLVLETEGEEQIVRLRPEGGFAPGRKIIGVEFADMGTLRLPPHLALIEGGAVAAQMTTGTAIGLSKFFADIARGRGDFTNIAGPVGILRVGSRAVADGWSTTIFTTAAISISLALLNLLPVPGLDGGRLAIIVIEGLRRKPFSQAAVGKATAIGLSLFIVLLVVVTYHDLFVK